MPSSRNHRRCSGGWRKSSSCALSRSLALSPALPRAANAVAEPLDLGLAEIDVRHPEECRDGLFRGVAEVGADDVREDVFARGLGRLGWIVYVARPILSVLSLIHISEPTRLGMISYAVF